MNAMKRLLLVVQFLMLTGFAVGIHEVEAQEQKIYVIEITNEVDLGLPPYVRRVLDEARDNHGAAIVLHVNTFGGRVDVATELKDAILNSKIPVLAYVDKRAISAGALITLCASKIAMAPGGTIGAATPVHGTGEKASEKVVSYMRSEMRATAEHNKRDPKIAEAMVDEDLMLADSALKKKGQLLTLTTEEALKVGYCDIEASSLEEALALFGYENPAIMRIDMNWGESLVRFFTSPVMNSILIMLGLGGLFYGIKTGHLGTVTVVGVAAMGLFFGAQYLADLTSLIEVALFIIGIGLIAMEIFVIPGFGIAGILGAVLIVASLFLALIGNFDLVSMDSVAVPLYTLAASFVGLAILVGLMIHYLPGSGAFNKFVLNTSSGSSSAGLVAAPVLVLHDLVGIEGQSLTTLRPAGMAVIGDERFDVITEGEFISAGERVKVVRVEGRKIIVRRVIAAESPVGERQSA
jgi:membrane-bound serine protease (ClpP class)